MSYAMTKEEREAFLSDVRYGVLSVEAKGRAPVSVPIWYMFEDGELFFFSVRSAKKVDLIRAAGRVTVCALTEEPPAKYVSMEGAVLSIQPCDFERDMRPIARRYLGEEKGDHYTEAVKATEEMVTIRIRPERWSSADYSKE
jgi:hypothetical protein